MPVGVFTVMLPVATEQVGCVGVAVGAAGAALIDKVTAVLVRLEQVPLDD